ncbi:SUKH-4 family immunity protein [Streptomyces rubellomurinus]|uniref:Uncharacterized protein n=1 Tax=Streptomyces rubellomurinus (strain ATCC 31215) TaxID=359131 RepID=A0A0F2TF50_STRR3|nr:SUKH-4 family immunity protein [Streptomyces rubellomurinus]KJS61833.1 hypothetical protein VM95_12610 [Streptomyces rubellomurinus]
MGTDTKTTTGAAGTGGRPLPAGLTHEPSREFLAERYTLEGSVLAYLDFEALRAEELRTVASWYEDVTVEGADRLFVLGETCYDAADCWAPAAVVLDGADGQVYLGCPDGSGGLDREPLASSLPMLFELCGFVEGVSGLAEQTRDPEAENHIRRGPLTHPVIARLVGEQMRETDPDLFRRTDDRPAHWETALLVRTLAFGARPGGPDGLAYVIDPLLVEDLAELTGGEVRRFTEDELPARLSHPATRRLLLTCGLPVAPRCMLDVDPEGPLTTMAEDYPEGYPADGDGEEASVRPHQAGFLNLAGWTYDLVVALDGATGRVELPDWADEEEPAAYLHRDLSALLYTLWTYERLRAERRRWDEEEDTAGWTLFDPTELLDGVAEETLRELDPEAWDTDAHFWPMLADDGHMGRLLE